MNDIKILIVFVITCNAQAYSPIIYIDQKKIDENVAKDAKEKKLFKKKCDIGNASSCEALAQLELKYDGIVSAMVSFNKSKFLLRKKCADFDMNGCVDLARLISYTEGDFLEVKNLLEMACYYFENREGCENLADFEDEMGMGDHSGRDRVCDIVGVWCSRYRGTTLAKGIGPRELPEDQFSIWVRFYQNLKYQMIVQDWVPRGHTIVPLVMEGWGRDYVY